VSVVRAFTFTDLAADRRTPAQLLEHIAASGYEGLVAKNRAAPYSPGKRSDAWCKHPLIQTAEVMRTPLTTAKALVEVAVAVSTSSEDVHRLGGKLLTVIAGQGRLLDGLLALAYSETTLDRGTRVDFAELAAAGVHAYGDEARDAGIELRTALSPAPLYADLVLLGRVVHDLVDNAVRYNVRRRGWVTIRSGGEPDCTATVSVTNSGPVVEATEVESLFEPFRRLRYDRIRQPCGSGLGLSIVGAVVRAHFGAVRAGPREGGGLTLHVRIPTRPMAPPGKR
jgi:signal transduction histidine kinase